MSSPIRKIKRKQILDGRKEAKKVIRDQLASFGQHPTSCLMCEKGFDKKNKEMITSWYIIQAKEEIRLYCPDCWKMAADIIEQYSKDKN